jgi:hypothetical protein
MTTLDPRSADLLARCDEALRTNASAFSAMHPDVLAALGRQRLGLVQSLAALRTQAADLEARRTKARAAVRALAQSNNDRAAIVEALLDLEEGRQPSLAPSSRVQKREEYRDCIETESLLRENRAARVRIEAQIDAVDATFASLPEAPAPVPAGPATTLPPREIRPGIW